MANLCSGQKIWYRSVCKKQVSRSDSFVSSTFSSTLEVFRFSWEKACQTEHCTSPSESNPVIYGIINLQHICYCGVFKMYQQGEDSNTSHRLFTWSKMSMTLHLNTITTVQP